MIEKIFSANTEKTYGIYALSDEDMKILLHFNSKGSVTLGELISGDDIPGSRMMKCLEKLFEFGYVVRDTDKEEESGLSMNFYKITMFGKRIASSILNQRSLNWFRIPAVS